MILLTPRIIARMPSISVVKCYLPVIEMPLDDLRALIAASAAKEAATIVAPLYNCVLA